LGDLGAFGPHPDRVHPLLLDNEIQVVQGNYDNSVGNGLNDCQCGYTDPRDNYFALLSYNYTFRNTSDEFKTYQKSLPAEIRFMFGGRRVLLCHGSPRQMNEFLWETTTPDHFLEKLFNDYHADLIFVTHSGIHWGRVLPNGRHFVNAGVIGRPENDGKTNVWYAILSENEGDRIKVEFIPLAYDYERLAYEMRHEEIAPEFVDTVLTGWWTTCLEILPAKERERGKY
jgi:predicted phosphodiesterase